MFGFLVINKPPGITSRKALNQVARHVRPAKIGHSGTLDPLATGVLIACVGPATRLTQYVQQLPKKYAASFRLGLQSSTEDIEGDVTELDDAPIIIEKQLSEALPEFVGTIMQTPPNYSAIKVAGERAYKLARRGDDVELKPRPVEIKKLDLTSFSYPDFQLDIVCGSGTYVRSLGRDIGQALGSNAIMTSLVRTAIGKFEISNAIELDELSPDACQTKLQPPLRARPDRDRVRVTREQIKGFADGVPIQLDEKLASSNDELLAVDDDDRLIAILRPKQPGLLAPSINFAHYWRTIEELTEK